MLDAIDRPFSSDEIRIRKPVRSRIDIRNRDDVALWCRRLGVTPLQLCSLIERVGSDATDLQHAMRTK
ncbi:MAG TPA: DUF3606 domain-containing protein [Rudaea sp.]|jgi:hypothetical protein|nr:DUF3606 domain-containing protein [Rudaea sp.]